MKKILLVGLLLLAGSTAFAQDSPKIEASVDYSYIRFVPQNNNLVQSFSLNGGGGAVAYYFNSLIGIKAEFQGYGSQTRNFDFSGNPAICPIPPCAGNVQANLFTYNVGPVFKFRTPHVQPFLETMFGGAHSKVAGNLAENCLGCVISRHPSNNAFDFIIGGGLDVPVNKTIAIRVAEVDYILTRFGNAFTNGNNNQSNFRYQAGVVFSF